MTTSLYINNFDASALMDIVVDMLSLWYDIPWEEIFKERLL